MVVYEGIADGDAAADPWRRVNSRERSRRRYDFALNRYERILQQHAGTTGRLTSAMAAASRWVRMSVAVDGANRPLRDVAAGVIAPVLTGYVTWLLRRAYRQGYRRLYFVSRDGQILLQLAEQLNATMGFPIQLRYLYGGRQAWNLATLDEVNEESLRWILAHATGCNVRRVLNRVDLEPEQVMPTLVAGGFGRDSWDQPLGAGHRAELAGLLSRSPLADRIRTRAWRRRSILAAYLRQERLLHPIRTALVDLGWTGRLQGTLVKVLRQIGPDRIGGFYFALHAGADRDSGPMEAYYYDRRTGEGASRRVPRLRAVMEAFCAADHGLTVGYRWCGGRIEPILRDDHASAVRDWGLTVVREAVRTFVENVRCSHADAIGDLRPAAADLLRAFCMDPTPAEAAAWGRFPYEDEQSGGHFRPLARPYHAADVADLLRRGTLAPYRGFWAPGGLAQTPYLLRPVLRAAALLGRLRSTRSRNSV